MFQKIYNFAVTASLVLATILVMLVLAPLTLFDYRVYFKYFVPVASRLFLLVLAIYGIKYRVHGLEHLPADNKFVIASKHQSPLETIIFARVLTMPCFILKQSLTQVPMFGLYMKKMAPIAINRSAKFSSMKYVLSVADDIIASGRPIILFPEGTRKRLDEPPAYKSGIFSLYEKGYPIYPVALNTGLVWIPKQLAYCPGLATVKILPALPTGLSKDEFMHQLEYVIEDNGKNL